LRNAPNRILALSGGGTPDAGDLPGARDEVRAIAGAYRGIETRLPAPPAGDVRDWRALESYDLIHVASHTRLLDRAPWQSEIEFGEGPESSLPAGRICTLRLRASLVVLSSCESAGGGILSGEGVAGLTSAFLAAGVPTVVATLWPVDDRVTARFMDHFYAALAEGLPVGGALARAQAAVRRNPTTQAPFYWAGFVLVGNDRVAENLERKGPPTAWFVIAGSALLVAVSLAILFGWRRLQARNALDVRTG
jgi:CHAT domain-containing protein